MKSILLKGFKHITDGFPNAASRGGPSAKPVMPLPTTVVMMFVSAAIFRILLEY
jgi:hypothetical protein